MRQDRSGGALEEQSVARSEYKATLRVKLILFMVCSMKIEARTQRVRDPVHGLISFDKNEPVDQLAWALIDTREFQRLRRIKQLGVSDFVYPGATHTRFAHCIGVFHTARKLIGIIKKEIEAVGEEFNPRRAETALIAALLHDLGHGPFSHTFEGVQKARGAKKRHEKWTADIIRNAAGEIQPLLDSFWQDESFCEAVAHLLEVEDPEDIYHAVVSSSFDADRLDYLRRDRLMTGTGAGAIDFDLLMEHLRVRAVDLEAPESDDDPEEQVHVATFCLDAKALPAAEQFLLARYTLHEQVYFHKTTRCIEHLVATILGLVADAATKPGAAKATGLEKNHPLLRFFAKDGEVVGNYLELDDVLVLSALERMQAADSKEIASLALRLRQRDLYKTLDLRSFGFDEGRQQRAARKIDAEFKAQVGSGRVFKDEGAAIGIYTQIGGDDERAHKKLHILDEATGPTEISRVSKVVDALASKAQFTRYYFESESERDQAKRRKKETA